MDEQEVAKRGGKKSKGSEEKNGRSAEQAETKKREKSME